MTALAILFAGAEADLRLAMLRLKERTEGFETGVDFSQSLIAEHVRESTCLLLTSTESRATYGFLVRPDTLTGQSVHVALVSVDGKPLEEWRSMTLVNGAYGRISVRPGWL